MAFHLRTRRFGVAALGVTILGGAAAATLSANPAAAAGIITAVTTVSCSVTGANWCISGNNTGSGIGVIGTSKTGTGLRGTSTSQYGLKATSVSNTAILAQTTSGATAISATAPNGYAVSGTGVVGTYGISKSGYGAEGQTSSGDGYGVVGLVTADGVGVYGGSGSGDGVEGYSGSGVALYGETLGSGTGAEALSGTGYGLIAETGGKVAVYGSNSNGNGADLRGSYIGVIGRAPASGGFPLVATDQNGNDLFFVNGAGDVYYKGGLSTFARTAGGATVLSYSSKTTAPTVEDTGTAQLVGGAAAVRLDPTFAATIDTASSYRVFVTPNGDTHGLFVAAKTPAGFIVRESQGGRSTVTFDYRIVATSAGQAGVHMAVTNAGSFAGRAPIAVAPVVPTVRAAAPLQPLAAPPAAQ